MSRALREEKKQVEEQSLKLANGVRTLREALVTTKNELKMAKAELHDAKEDNKKLRKLLSEDHSAVSSYLGIVLGKKIDDLAPAEKKQVRTLLKDNGEGQA